MSNTPTAPPRISDKLKDNLTLTLDVCRDGVEVVYADALGMSLTDRSKYASILFLVIEQMKQAIQNLDKTESVTELAGRVIETSAAADAAADAARLHQYQEKHIKDLQRIIKLQEKLIEELKAAQADSGAETG